MARTGVLGEPRPKDILANALRLRGLHYFRLPSQNEAARRDLAIHRLFTSQKGTLER